MNEASSLEKGRSWCRGEEKERDGSTLARLRKRGGWSRKVDLRIYEDSEDLPDSDIAKYGRRAR